MDTATQTALAKMDKLFNDRYNAQRTFNEETRQNIATMLRQFADLVGTVNRLTEQIDNIPLD